MKMSKIMALLCVVGSLVSVGSYAQAPFSSENLHQGRSASVGFSGTSWAKVPSQTPGVVVLGGGESNVSIAADNMNVPVASVGYSNGWPVTSDSVAWNSLPNVGVPVAPSSDFFRDNSRGGAYWPAYQTAYSPLGTDSTQESSIIFIPPTGGPVYIPKPITGSGGELNKTAPPPLDLTGYNPYPPVSSFPY